MTVFRKPRIDKQAELANCTFVKTILMLTVVLYHATQFWGGNWFEYQTPVLQAKPLTVLASWLNTFHIYGFVLVSGYLFYYLKHEKGKYTDFLPFVANKAKRLLVPYAFVSLVWVIPFAVYFFHYDLKDVILKFAFGTSPNQLWFLLMLFFVFMLFHPTSSFFQKHNIAGAILVLFAYGIGMIGWYLDWNVFQIFRAFTYLPLFWIGFKIRQYGSDGLRKVPLFVYLLAHTLLFLFARFLSRLDGAFFVLLHQGFSFVLRILGAVTAFLVLQDLASHTSVAKSNALRFLGKHSMVVYLLHQQIIYVCICLLNGLVNPYIHASVNFVVSMVLSLGVSALLNKFKFTRILIGEK